MPEKCAQSHSFGLGRGGGGGVGEPRTGIIDGEAGCLRLKETTLTMSRLPIRLGWNELTTYLLALHYVFV